MSEKEETTKSFVLEYETGLTKKDRDICEKKLRIGKQIYNAFLSECIKRINAYKSDANFIKLASEYKAAKKENNSDKIKRFSKELENIKKSYGWYGDYCLADVRMKQSHHYSGSLRSSVLVALSIRAYRTARKYEKAEAKNIHFYRKDEDFSIEGNRNSDGIYYRNNMICFDRDTRLPLKKKSNTSEEYYKEALKNRIKFCRLLSRTIRGKKRYYVQLILEGIPPNHREYGDGKIEIHNVGLSYVDLSINGNRKSIVLVPETVVDEEKEIELLTKMDYSRRAMNPENYTISGAIIKGSKKWNYSNNYKKLRYRLKELRRREAATRMNSHGRLTNELLSQGSNITIENQSYKELVKMNKDITSHGATKNQNKSIKNKAPGAFVSMLNRKLGYVDKQLIEKQNKKRWHTHLPSLFFALSVLMLLWKN